MIPEVVSVSDTAVYVAAPLLETLHVEKAPSHKTDPIQYTCHSSYVEDNPTSDIPAIIPIVKASECTIDSAAPRVCTTSTNTSLVGNVHGTNRYTTLVSLEMRDDSYDQDVDPNMVELMTPSGQRLIRKRSVK